MYHYRTFIALILIGLFVPVSAWAQTHLFHPVEQPLSNSYVRCIYKDSKGYLWAGTFNGLNRYDGAGIQTYHHEAGKTNTLSHNMVNALLEDHQQTLWVGTSEGLNYYDREKDAFHYIIHRPDLENRHNNSCITALCQPDTTTLWMGTRGGGVNIYRYAEKRFDFLFLTASKLLDEASNHITCLQQHHNTIWAGTAGGLFRINRETLVVSPVQHPLLARTNIIALALQGDSLWVATPEALYLAVLSENTPAVFAPVKQVPQQNISVLHVHQNGEELWLGYENGGLGCYRPADQTFSHYHHQPGLRNGLPDNTIWSLHSDEAGRLWVGTYKQGLHLHDPYYDKFLNFEHNPYDPLSLSHNNVRAFAEDPEGRLYVATDGGGLSLFVPHAQEAYSGQALPDHLQNLPTQALTTLLYSKQHQLWAGTWGSGLVQIDLDKKTRKIHPLSPTNSAANRLFSLYEDRAGNIWAGTAGEGLYVKKKNSPHFQKAGKSFEGLELPEDAFITFIFEDQGKDLWIGSLYGLFRFHRQNGSIIQKSVYYKELSGKGLESNSFQCVHQDARGRIWLGTFDRGVARYHPETDRFTHIHTEHGLAGNMIQAILSDQDGQLWISSEQGLSCWDPERSTCINYSEADGLLSKNFQGNAALSLNKGSLLFGTTEGFHLIDPKRLPKNPHSGAPQITALHLLTRSAEADSSSSWSPLHNKQTLKLSHQQNSFTLTFSARNYTRPENNRYRYKMDGWDPQWNESKNPEVNYHNLSPGRYTFLLQAANNDGIWSENTAQVNLSIQPPLWRSWALLPLYLLLAGSIVYLLIVLRLRRLQLLHNYQNNKAHLQVYEKWSHELRTALSLIAAPSEKLLDQPALSPEIRAELQRLRKNTLQLSNLSQKLLLQKADITKNSAPEASPPRPDTLQAQDEHPIENEARHEILLIEDNEELLDFLDRELRRQYTIYKAVNGEEGLQMALEKLPDLVVSDVMMPGMSGTTLCAQLKKDLSTCHIPILLLTAKASDQDQAEGLLTGADAYITKPFSMKVLLAQIQQLIQNRQQLYHTFRQSGYLLPSRNKSQKSDENFLSQIVALIRGDLSNTNLNVEALAEKTELSRTQLYKKIKALTGLSAVEFIREVRLKEAVLLMEEGDLSLTEVAYQSGFNSPSYFSRSFKEYYGFSPSELTHKKMRKE